MDEDYTKKSDLIEKYLNKKKLDKTLETTQDRILKRIPNPKKILSIFLICGGLAFVFNNLPLIIGYLFGNTPDILFALVQIFGFTNLLLGLILFMIPIDLWIPWVTAKLTGKPIVPIITKSKQFKLIVPREMTHNVWGLTDDEAVEPDSDAILMGPGKVPVMLAVPECGKGLDIRKLINKIDFNIDMTAYKQYAKYHEQKAWAKARKLAGGFQPYIMPVILLLIIGGGMYSFVDKRMDQQGSIDDYSQKLAQCKFTLAENGIKPTIKTPPTNTTNTPQPIEKPAKADISFK